MLTPILPLSRMKEALDVADGVTTYDKRIARLIGAATGLFQVACRRATFARSEQVEIRNTSTNFGHHLDLYGSSETGIVHHRDVTRLLLAYDPVDPDAAFEVRYDPRSRFEDGTVVPDTAYTVDYAGGAVTLDFSTVQARRSLRLSYTAGYPVDPDTRALAEATCPDDLATACETWVLRAFNAQSAETQGADKAAKPSREGAIDRDIAQLLLPYRRVLTGSN